MLIGCFLLLSLVNAKIPMVVSTTMENFVSKYPVFSHTFKVLPQHDELSTYNAFRKKEVKLAILRSDFLADLYKENLHKRMYAYHIIGKLSRRAVLYFAMKEESNSIDEKFEHKRISIGNLGDRANQYFKHFLKNKKVVYSNNYISEDAYRTISELRRDKIDGFFLFATDSYRKFASQYLREYPIGLKKSLKQYDGLYCEDAKYCYATYYLVASDSLNKNIMRNIYKKIVPFLDTNKELSANLGQYYIYTGHKIQVAKKTTLVYKEPKQTSKKNKNIVSFHRTPWMDIAIKEAIKGKGSAENVLPMLDLSYKYIRFAKGSRGITTAPNDNKEGSWCAAYICWTLHKSGYKIHSKGRMASQSFRYFNHKLYRKIDKPIFGAITLYTSMKNPAHGHVGYLFGRTKNGRYILLGGNQSNRLKFADYPSRFGSYKLRGFYVPIGYKVKEADKLTVKDIYDSANRLNKKYGIMSGKYSHKVR
jgi:uncharacterized protein (TIGR02594 family)